MAIQKVLVVDDSKTELMFLTDLLQKKGMQVRTAENAEEALKRTCEKTNAIVSEYSAGPVFMKEKEKGAHEWMIEFKKKPADMAVFQKALDETLQTLNSDYEAKRYNNMTLNPLVINVARENLFYDWLKDNNKLGGQHKIPRLSNQRDYLEQLKSMQFSIIV